MSDFEKCNCNICQISCENLKHLRERLDRVVNNLIKEGKRVGKTSWCPDIYCEREAYERLNPSWWHEEKYPQEEMEKTVKRRETQEEAR